MPSLNAPRLKFHLPYSNCKNQICVRIQRNILLNVIYFSLNQNIMGDMAISFRYTMWWFFELTSMSIVFLLTDKNIHRIYTCLHECVTCFCIRQEFMLHIKDIILYNKMDRHGLFCTLLISFGHHCKI